MMKILLKSIALTALVFASVNASPYTDLTKKFSRIKSTVMVRQINVPTLANLDYAAYNANPVRFDPSPIEPKAPAVAPVLTGLTFNGALSQVYDGIDKTPLTAAEKGQPIAWIPLQNRLWEVVKTDAIGALASKINGEKWGDPSIFQQFQEVAALYLHQTGDKTEFFVRVDFMPWVTFIKGIKDDDNDGFKNIYGKLALESIPADSLAKALAWIRGDYSTKTLARTDIVDWANILASYWYPSLNTDVLDMAGATVWPTAETEPEIVAEVKGLKVKDFVTVIRGRPMGMPIYNIYVVPPSAAPVATVAAAAAPTATIAPVATGRDTTTSKNFANNNARFEAELKAQTSYVDWTKKNSAFNDSMSALLKLLPPAQMGFKGKGDWLFFRKSVEYLLGGDLSNQPADRNPVTNILEFKKLCDANNINFLFIPIPNKEELYYSQLPFSMPKGMTSYANPYSRKILKDLQAAGVEVVDALTILTEAKTALEKEPAKKGEDIYQHQDTHWTTGGLLAVATAIAARVKAYSWYASMSGTQKSYTGTDTTFSRKGDIVERLPESQQQAFPAVMLKAQQVKNADGSLYKSDPAAPILLMGDSFTGVFELVDCKAAGVGAHIAAQSKLPVEIITSWGGGPGVRQKVLRAHKKNLNEKKLIIYMMVARDLYNYTQGWEPLEK